MTGATGAKMKAGKADKADKENGARAKALPVADPKQRSIASFFGPPLKVKRSPAAAHTSSAAPSASSSTKPCALAPGEATPAAPCAPATGATDPAQHTKPSIQPRVFGASTNILPPIADDLDERVTVYAKPLYDMTLFEGPDTASDLPQCAHEMVHDDTVVGERGRGEAQWWSSRWALSDSNSSKLEEKGLLIGASKQLLPGQLLDLQMVADFVTEFGATFLDFDLKPKDSWSLGILLRALHSPSETYPFLSLLYRALIVCSHPHEKKKWSTMTSSFETQALIIHHLLTVPSTTNMSATPSIDALISFFALLSFPRIPPQVHVALLTCLVQSLRVSSQFKEHFDARVVGVLDATRKTRAANLKRRTELRASVKAVEARIRDEEVAVKRMERELRVFGCVVPPFLKKIKVDADFDKQEDPIICEPDGVVGEARPSEVKESSRSASPGSEESGVPAASEAEYGSGKSRRQASLDADKKRKEKENELHGKLDGAVKELNQKIRALAALERQVNELDREDEALKEGWEKASSGMRVTRFLGTDRYFKEYYWLDISSRDLSNTSATSLKGDKKDVATPSTPLSDICIISLPPESNSLDISSNAGAHVVKASFSASLTDLKSLIKSLNDRGHRERELLTVLRERLKPYGLDIPTFSNVAARRAWERLGKPGVEAREDEALARSAKILACEWTRDEVAVGAHFEEVSLRGVRDRILELLALTHCDKLTADAVEGLESLPQFVSAVETCIVSCGAMEEDVREAVARFEGVNCWSLFSVAIGFLCMDVKKGKIGTMAVYAPPEAVKLDLKLYENTMEDLDAYLRRQKRTKPFKGEAGKKRRAKRVKSDAQVAVRASERNRQKVSYLEAEADQDDEQKMQDCEDEADEVDDSESGEGDDSDNDSEKSSESEEANVVPVRENRQSKRHSEEPKGGLDAAEGAANTQGLYRGKGTRQIHSTFVVQLVSTDSHDGNDTDESAEHVAPPSRVTRMRKNRRVRAVQQSSNDSEEGNMIDESQESDTPVQTRATRSRKRHSDEHSESEIEVKRITRSCVKPEVDDHRSAMDQMKQTRSERLSRRSQQ